MKTYHSDEELYRIAEKRVKDIKGFYWHFFWYLAVNIFLSFGGTIKRFVLDGSFEANDIHFTTFSVWFFWGIGLVAHWLRVFGKNVFFSKNWEEKKIREFMEKDKLDN
jgi:hypothetical protein